MRSVQFLGVLPPSMAENSHLGDWSATLSLLGDLGGLTGVELLGRDALAFQASLLTGFPAIVLTPGAAVDFEALVASGRAPVLDVSLRLHFADGSVVDDPTPRSVAVLDVDDTPPTGLAFASGGTVVAGAIGAAIGRLAVTDPDSTHFTFTFPDDEAWRFEVVGNVLKLRDGVSLGLDDMPDRPLIVEVWDGHHSAAFVLTLHVISPATQLTNLPAGPATGGFAQVDAGTVVTLGESRIVREAEALADGERVVTLQNNQEVILPAAERTYFADGFQDSGPASTGVQAAAVMQALTGHAPDATALATLVARAEAGTSWTDMAAASAALATLPAQDGDAVVTLFHNALGRDPTAEELALQAGRLASGVSRAQLAVDLALGDEGLAGQPDGGVWVADALGEDAAWWAGTGGLPGAAEPAAAAQDQVWLL